MNTSDAVPKLVFPNQTFEWKDDAFITIGKHESCSIMLDDPSVTVVHACLERITAGFKLVDCISAQGTFINNQRIPDLLPQLINSTCVLHFGKVKGYFIIPPKVGKDFQENMESLKKRGWQLINIPHEQDLPQQQTPIRQTRDKSASKIKTIVIEPPKGQ